MYVNTFCSPQEFDGGEEDGYTSGSGRNTRRQARSAVKAAPWETINLFTQKNWKSLMKIKIITIEVKMRLSVQLTRA